MNYVNRILLFVITTTLSLLLTSPQPAMAVPGAPTGVTATSGNGQAAVSFSPPASNGGNPILGYTVTASPGGKSAQSNAFIIAGPPYDMTFVSFCQQSCSMPYDPDPNCTPSCTVDPATTINVTGLTNGTTYTFTVTASNSDGSSVSSAPSNGVTPTAGGTLVLARNSASLDAEELKITAFLTASGYAYQVTDATALAGSFDPSPFKTIIFRTNTEPTAYNNPTIINKLKTAIEGGSALFPEYYGAYLAQYLGWGTVSLGGWGPCVNQNTYFVTPIDNHAIFNGISTWDPPTSPDQSAQMYAGIAVHCQSEPSIGLLLTGRQTIRFWALVTTYGWAGQSTGSSYCQTWGGCTSQRNVSETGIDFAVHGVGKIVWGLSPVGLAGSALATTVNAAGTGIARNMYAWAATAATAATAADSGCGSSKGGTFAVAPAANLCTAGTASTVTSSGSTWNWDCVGTSSTTSCSASIQASLPTVTTGTVSAITANEAVLSGTASANYASTSVSFEYGPTGSYGSSVTASSSPLAADASGAAVSAAVTGLACGTTYHYRVTAANSVGTSNGADASFSTAACPPISTSSLRLWLKADSGITRDASDRVSAWSDQSGNNIVVTNATLAKQPLYSASSVNLLPSVHFDGIDDWLQTASPVSLLTGSQNNSVFVVVRPGATQKQYADILDYSHASNVNLVMQQNGSTTNNFGFRGGSGQTLSTSAFQVISAVFTNGSYEYSYRNGQNQVSVLPATVSYSEPNYFTLGNKSNEAFPRQFNGDIAEVIIYNRALGTQERQNVEQSLLIKYGLAPQQNTLTIAKTGAGNGAITSVPDGIICGATCSAAYNAGTVVTLSSISDSGSTFDGWSGACTGTGTCQVTMDALKNVSAAFGANGSCGSAVTGVYPAAPAVNLCISGSPSSVTQGATWNWTCSGSGGGAPASCSAGITTYPVSVTIAGTGSGNVNSVPSGIACISGTCSSNFTAGSSVSLVPVVSGSAKFSGWSGDCTNGSGNCSLSIDGAKSVTATFNTPPNARIGTTVYASLGEAYAKAGSGVVIEAQAIEFIENLILGRAVSVTLKGGHDPAFAITAGAYTSVSGSLVIKDGRLVADHIKVK